MANPSQHITRTSSSQYVIRTVSQHVIKADPYQHVIRNSRRSSKNGHISSLIFKSIYTCFVTGWLLWKVFPDGLQSRGICQHVSDVTSPKQRSRVHRGHPSHLCTVSFWHSQHCWVCSNFTNVPWWGLNPKTLCL